MRGWLNQGQRHTVPFLDKNQLGAKDHPSWSKSIKSEMSTAKLTGREAFLLSTQVPDADVTREGDAGDPESCRSRGTCGGGGEDQTWTLLPHHPWGPDGVGWRGDYSRGRSKPHSRKSQACILCPEPCTTGYFLDAQLPQGCRGRTDWKVPSVLSLLGLTGSPTPSSHFPGHHRKLISWSLLKDSVSELSLPPSRNPNSHPISSGSSPPLLHPPILETDPAAPRAVALR